MLLSIHFLFLNSAKLLRVEIFTVINNDYHIHLFNILSEFKDYFFHLVNLLSYEFYEKFSQWHEFWLFNIGLLPKGIRML